MIPRRVRATAHWRARAVLGLALAGPLVARASAQEPAAALHLPAELCTRALAADDARFGSPLDELRRIAAVAGCTPAEDPFMRRGGSDVETLPDGRWLRLRALPTSLLATERTAYAGDRNNGALWEGVGLSSALRTGVQLSLPFVTLSLQPELLFQQNGDFDTRSIQRVGFSEFMSPHYTGIDLPQRFGTEAWWELVPGDSYVRADVAWATAGASTESLWRGPAVRYPIVMSNTAGGFPHLFLGTSRGVDVYVGDFQAEVVWGRLTESDYFDAIEDNDESDLVNVTLALQPRWLDGLSLGVTRSYQYDAGSESVTDVVVESLGFVTTRNRVGNELASLFARWVFEEAGAEVYGEWAREDAFGEWAEFFQEPDHSQGYQIGVQAVRPLNERVALRLHGELAHLQEKGEARTDTRPIPIYYTHHLLTQGYTHRGQLLGAFIGPGADAQYLALDALLERGTIGAWFERVRRNELSPEAFELRRLAPFEHDTEIIGGIRALWFFDRLTISGDLSRSLRYNREFRGDDRSWRAELRVDWSPDLEVTL